MPSKYCNTKPHKAACKPHTKQHICPTLAPPLPTERPAMPTLVQYLLKLLLLAVLHLWSGTASQFLLWDFLVKYLHSLPINAWWLKAPYLLYLSLAAAMVLSMAFMWVLNQKLPRRWVRMWPYVCMPVLILLLVLSILSLLLWVFTIPSLLFALYLYHWHKFTPAPAITPVQE